MQDDTRVVQDDKRFVQDDKDCSSVTRAFDRQALAIRADGAADFQIFAAAGDRDVFPAAGFGGAGQQAPGFAIFFEVTVGVAGVGIEAGAFAAADGGDGNDVPDIFGDNVGDEEVDFGGGVDGAAGSGGLTR